MTPEQFENLEALFHELKDLPPEAREREALVRCGGDQTVLSELRSMLARNDDLSGAGNAGDTNNAATHSGPELETTTNVGNKRSTKRSAPEIAGYEFVRDLARGGQGYVFQAIQKATKRKVAIKVLLDGAFASPASRRRFEREVQLIAQLRHPFVIAVFDSGETSDGHPYYVMDYIRGEALHRYVRQHDLSLEETLQLFLKVCDAIRYAHERGVVHRDLKPANILVDSDGNPRVLDFGLAKPLAGPTESLVSISRELYGTLPYMSPEQARGVPDEVDARSDVYALGVVLYELLTGQFPYDVAGNVGAVLRNITETPPEPLAIRWSSRSGVTHRAASRQRSARCPLDADVQAITLKSLEKERRYRYASANEFARDIQNYLDGRPISVQSKSIVYRLRHSMRRHRRAMILGAIGLVVTASVGVAIRGWRQTETQVKRVTADKTLADQHLLEAESLLADHTNLDRAERLIEDALQAWPRSERAFVDRARLRVLQALDARSEHKAGLVDAALLDLEHAYVFADGVPFLDLLTDDEAQLAFDDSVPTTALWLAADILTLSGRSHPASALLAALGESEPGGGTMESSNTFYDPQHDPLLADEKLSLTPDMAALEPARNVTLHRALPSRIRMIDPLGNDSYNRFVTELLYDPLFVVDQHARTVPNPNVVVSVETDDGVVFEIALRDDLRWHDGVPFTADDVAFTWQKLAGQPATRPVERVEALSPTRVRFTHREFDHSAAWYMGLGILPRHRVEAIEAEHPGIELNELREILSSDPIGNGPYRFVSSDAVSGEIKLVRWDEYTGVLPYIDRVVFVTGLSADKQTRMLADRRLDACELRSNQFLWDVNGASFAGVRKVVAPWSAYDYIAWNLRHPLLAERDVRRAIAHAAPLDRMRVLCGGGLFDPMARVFAWRAWGLPESEAEDLIVHAPGAARDLLDAAGWIPAGEDGIREKNGVRATLELLLPIEVPKMQRVALELREALLAVGIQMQVTAIPARELLARLQPGDFDAYMYGVIPSPTPADDARRWTSADGPDTRDGKNYIGYSSDEVDDLFRDAARATSVPEQAEMLRRAQGLIYADQPHLFLWRKPALWAFSERVRGVELSPRGLVGFYPGARAWWVAPDGR